MSDEKSGAWAPDITNALFLIDGNSLAYRAFYALPETIATADGFPTNALYGFSTMLVKIITDYKPAGVVVAWDTGKKVFRHEKFEEYKAGRKPMPDNLSLQFEHFEEIVSSFGFENLKKEGYEADDVLATLAREARENRQKTVIVTADRDALQLVGDQIYVMTNTKGVSEVRIYDSGAVEDRYGIPPEKVPDFIGLKGDTSDNIPGIPGVGDKTAALMLAEHQTLEELLAHTADFKGKRRQLLEEYADQALMSKELATMDDEVPVEILPFMGKHAEPDRTRLRETMERFEFNTLLRRLEELGLVEGTVSDTREIFARNIDPDRLADVLSKAREAALAWEEKGGEVMVALYYGGDEAQLAVVTRSRLAEILSSQSEPVRKKNILLICHDYKKFLKLVPNDLDCSHDTEVAAYLLKPTARTYSLDQLASVAGIRVDLEADSSDGRTLATMAVQAFLLAQQQEEALGRKGLAGLFHDWEMPLVRIFAEMERVGIRLDLARLGEISAKASDQLEQLEDEIHKLAGESFNIDSPQQLSIILFQKLDLPAGKKTKTGFSTDASVLKGLRGSHAIIPKIETYRELAKLSNTYLLALPRIADPETWRIHTTFNQTVTATGRISSSNPNLQNIPIRTPLGEKIRDCFVAEEGHMLVVADYSQVELRIMAHLSGEPKLRLAFASGEDVHRDTAAEVFNLKAGEVTSIQRNRAKAVNFGIMYGISGFGLAEQLDISREEAAGYIETYMARYPKVAAFRASTIEQAREDGFVTTVLGRRRAIPELRSSDDRIRKLGERLAVNTVIQGSAADIIKIAMVNSHRALKKERLDAYLVLQVHDELVFEASEAEAPAVAELARREMVGAWQLDQPLEVDVGIGETWVEAK
ncbi:MAG: DNA polymerase I [Thermoleophilia bacterium]